METEMKIKPTETIIDSDWYKESNHLTLEESRKIVRRMTWLADHYLEKIIHSNWETLYRDPNDHRYWEWTYPRGELQGGGPPLLRCITVEEAITKYKIAPQYIPELKPKSTETVIDSYELTKGLSLIAGSEIFFKIDWLMQYYFKEILKVSEEVILYLDPGDHRYWELTYPRGYNYGSGYPFLKYLTGEEVAAKYNIKTH